MCPKAQKETQVPKEDVQQNRECTCTCLSLQTPMMNGGLPPALYQGINRQWVVTLKRKRHVSGPRAGGKGLLPLIDKSCSLLISLSENIQQEFLSWITQSEGLRFCLQLMSCRVKEQPLPFPLILDRFFFQPALQLKFCANTKYGV